MRLNGGFACSQMAAGNSYFLGINTNDFFLKDNKKSFTLWLNVPKVIAHTVLVAYKRKIYDIDYK